MTEGDLSKAANRMREAFEMLEDLHRNIEPLAAVRIRRRWTAEEYDRYLLLRRAEAKAVRRYLAARRTFDAIRTRSPRAPRPDPSPTETHLPLQA